MPEQALAALGAAEARAALRWAATQLADRTVLVVADEILMPELPILAAAGISRLRILAAGPVARIRAEESLPADARLLDGTLSAPPEGPLDADALLWPSVFMGADAARGHLDAVLGLVPPGAPVVLGFEDGRDDAVARARSRLPDAREVHGHSVIVSMLGVGTPTFGDAVSDVGRDAPAPGRRYLTTASSAAGDATRSGASAIAPIGDWLAVTAQQDERIADLERQLLEAEQSDRERGSLQDQLVIAETELAQVPLLREQVDRLRHERDLLRQDRDARLVELRAAQRVLQDVMGSLSWRITQPLRALKPRRWRN